MAKIRDAIAWKADQWKKEKRGLTLEGDYLTRAPRGYAENHPLIDDLKRQDFVVSVAFSDAQLWGAGFLRDVTAAAKKMRPLLEFLAQAQGRSKSGVRLSSPVVLCLPGQTRASAPA